MLFRSVSHVVFIVLIASCHAIALAGQVDDPEERSFHSASDVLALSNAQADRGYPVAFRGVVTGVTEYGIFVQDATAGIWVSIANSTREYSSGEFVQVRGKTIGGLFSPDVSAVSVTKLGRAKLPIPKTVSLKDLLSGSENDQFVSLEGEVRSVSIRPNVSELQRVWLDLLVSGTHIFATLPLTNAAQAERLLGATIRVRAAVACTKNQDRQITSVVLSVSGMDNVEVVKAPPGDLFDAPLIPLKQVLQYRSPVAPDGRIRVKGVVTYVQPGESLIIEDPPKAALVQTLQLSPVEPGDEIEVSGYPTTAPAGPFISDGIYRVIRRVDSPHPRKVTLEELAQGRLNYNLIQITGKLIHHVSDPRRQELLIQQGSSTVIAELGLAAKDGSLEWLRDGSIVQVTGITLLSVEGSWNQGGPTASALHYSIMLRCPSDVQVLAPPSWWSAQHLFYVALLFAALMLLFFVLALYGRLQHLRLEAISEERERVAHDIHDTLAQSFAGIGFQLQAIRKAIPQDQPELRRQVETARALVRHSHKEARQSIDPRDLRTLEGVDVLQTLEESAKKLVDGGGVTIETKQSGPAQSIPPLIKDVLLHVGLEAVANAIRHADPKSIKVTMDSANGAIKLIVADDGVGFEERGDTLGLGLRGMRKRAASVGAALTLSSKVNEGTSVTMVCPLPRGLIARFYYTWSLERSR